MNESSVRHICRFYQHALHVRITWSEYGSILETNGLDARALRDQSSGTIPKGLDRVLYPVNEKVETLSEIIKSIHMSE